MNTLVPMPLQQSPPCGAAALRCTPPSLPYRQAQTILGQWHHLCCHRHLCPGLEQLSSHVLAAETRDLLPQEERDVPQVSLESALGDSWSGREKAGVLLTPTFLTTLVLSCLFGMVERTVNLPPDSNRIKLVTYGINLSSYPWPEIMFVLIEDRQSWPQEYPNNDRSGPGHVQKLL